MNDAATTIVQLVNTLDVGTGEDLLADVDAATRSLRRAGLLDASETVSERGRRDIIVIREALRCSLLAHHEGTEDPEALRVIEAAMTRHPLTVRFGDDGGELVSARPGVGCVVAAVADAMITLQRDGHWHRVRVCPSSDCLEAFYDSSRGGTRRWCSMEACGNRIKVEAYRNREKLSG